MRTKKTRKQAKQGDKKPKNKEKKSQVVEKEEKNKNRGFHEMAIEFASPIKFAQPCKWQPK
jgi:hypothetical protein